MAKAKSGGSRSFLRGRLANDVYSIGKDGAGKKQQVVRSLAESVANPQTTAQMRGRMIMSTVMQTVSGLSPLIDHSFDGFPNGQPSISEFIRRNYALVKADVAAHPSRDNAFALSKYQEKGAKPGAWLVSDGEAIAPSIVGDATYGAFAMFFRGFNNTSTFGQLRSALAMGSEDYLTLVGILSTGKVVFVRFRVDDSVADETVVSAANIVSLFKVDNPFGLTLTGAVTETNCAINVEGFGDDVQAEAEGVIFTEKVDGGFRHSTTVLHSITGFEANSEAVLPTYPIGQERFLNGGEL